MSLKFEKGLKNKTVKEEISLVENSTGNGICSCSIFSNIEKIIASANGVYNSNIFGKINIIESKTNGVQNSHCYNGINTIIVGLSGVISSIIEGSVKIIKAGNTGLLKSNISGDLDIITAGAKGVDESNIDGNIHKIISRDSCIDCSVVRGSVGYLKTSCTGIANSFVGENVEEINANLDGILTSIVCGSVGKINVGYSGVSKRAFVGNFIGGIKSKYAVFDDAHFNLVIGDIESLCLDKDCCFANLVISDKVDVKEFNGTANVIVPCKTDQFIQYEGDFEELKKYAKQNPKSLTGLRCLKTDAKCIKNLEKLLELENSLEEKLGSKNLDYVKLAHNVLLKRSSYKNEDLITMVKEYFALQDFLADFTLTTGSRQLIAARFLNQKKQGVNDYNIKKEIKRLYDELKYLEDVLKGGPTFGCEFCFEAEAIKKFSSNYSLDKEIKMANELLIIAGNEKIRLCESLEKQNSAEFRINPAYAPITIALIKELFDLEIFPRDVLGIYSVNMVGKHVLDMALPLILVNHVIGITSDLKLYSNEDCKSDELAFKDVHVYHGATVDEKTGLLNRRTAQLNILAGITAKIENNEKLKPFQKLLENDVKERLNKMFAPFLLSEDCRKEWKNNIFEIFELSEEKLIILQEKLKDAEYQDKIWRTEKDLKIADCSECAYKVQETYDFLEQIVMNQNQRIYSGLLSAQL
ncbi:hypothetical protein HYV79_04540 [Candidatus Woesearchaeota archaeon]|nr:hypothetical protein [Candidatus Woesearchaeota archaeon]